MNLPASHALRYARSRGFTLVEMLVVIVIISILMTAGAIGINNLGGKGVTSGVDTAEALVDEARSLALGKNLRTALLVARELTNNPNEDRRRILVAHEATGSDGSALDPSNPNPDWVLTSRGALLPDQTFFSEKFSEITFESAAQAVEYIEDSKIKDVKEAYKGSYFVYRFNSQGMPYDPRATPTNKVSGTSFVIGTGSRMLSKPATSHPPKVSASARRDFGGFMIWRSGRTSAFRSPDQISSELKSIASGTTF